MLVEVKEINERKRFEATFSDGSTTLGLECATIEGS